MGTIGTITAPAERKRQSEALSPDNYSFLVRYVQEATGIVLGGDKLYLLESRLTPVLEQEHLRSLNELSNRLRCGAPESLRRQVAESMTTHETLFFRDSAVFDVLRKDLLPELAERRRAIKTLRIWSAACSSGQEPYSLAMMLLEAGYSDWKLDILGTDLSSQILARAAAGRFFQIEVSRGLPAPLLVKYFLRAGLDWQIKQDVRRLVRFELFDLRHRMRGHGPFDIVLCRNVLIYFDIPTRKQILGELQASLAPGGYLVLGGSETAPEVGLVRRTFGTTVVYQNTAAGVR
jgi:chemotaxis protein methyltransferase CheR